MHRVILGGKIIKPRLVWSPTLRNWCCTGLGYRACAPGARLAYLHWRDEITLRVFFHSIDGNHHVHTSH